ncbi:MAG: sugar phosphate isomerase/epimerase [Defluviitaleaceae bacterium]|nr:sugar phosphate isomerase/epimerase [Defluviitaleaceae bacterium]
MKLCFSTLGCPDWDINQVAAKAAEYGFDGVELRIHGDRHVDPALSQEERKRIKEMFAEKGVAIPILSGYTHFARDDLAYLKANEDTLVQNAQLAADLGAKYLRTFLGMEAFTTQGAEFMRSACNKAADLGVTVLIEIHGAPKNGADAMQLLHQVKSPGLAILWDVHHSIAGGETLAETWQNAGKYVRHIHLKDADAAGKPCLTGQGVFPVADAVRLLACNGFDGFVSFEWEKTWIPDIEEPEVALPDFVGYVRGIDIEN